MASTCFSSSKENDVELPPSIEKQLRIIYNEYLMPQLHFRERQQLAILGEAPAFKLLQRFQNLSDYIDYMHAVSDSFSTQPHASVSGPTVPNDDILQSLSLEETWGSGRGSFACSRSPRQVLNFNSSSFMSSDHSPSYEEVPLPLSMEKALRRIYEEKTMPPLDAKGRRKLAVLGEEAALRILQKFRSLSDYITFVVGNLESLSSQGSVFFSDLQNSESSLSESQQDDGNLNSLELDEMRRETSLSSPSLATQKQMNLNSTSLRRTSMSNGPLLASVPYENHSYTDNDVSDSLCMQEQGRKQNLASSSTSSRMNLNSARHENPGISNKPILEALEKLEFRKAFLILSYCGKMKLEDVVTVDLIQRLQNMPIRAFESELWRVLGSKCTNENYEIDRRENEDWDSGRTYLYHCYVDPDATYRFKGPYLHKQRTHLQRVLGDENVLLVKFAEESAEGNDFLSSSEYRTIAKDGILVGLRRFCFFVFKDGGKEEKKKNPTSSAVKCYFVCKEANAFADMRGPYTSFTNHEARCLFMHVHTVSSVVKYMARFSLILSKTVQLDIDLASVNIERISDIPCLPLLIQSRLFHNGIAVKGTFLVNKKLPPKTIQIRPSMIKVEADPKLLGTLSANSLEIVSTSSKPRKTSYLSRYLIALLNYGGVPTEFFMELLVNALKDAQQVHSNKRAALSVSLRYGEMDDFLVPRMILSGIPLDEPYLKTRLSVIMNEEKKGLKGGKLPINECYYLMGTADPTGRLKGDEVCIILDHGEVTGDVLVYRHPGLHFGDIHVLTATTVRGLKEIVGNSKYAIFFPTKRCRSLADEIAKGDFDGDMYWVSTNPQVVVPKQLKAEKFPHFMERQNSYCSKSVLGLIYDEVNLFRTTELQSNDAWKLPCFREQVVPSSCEDKWQKLYVQYRAEMTSVMEIKDKEAKDIAAKDVIQKYKQILYGTTEFDDSTREKEVIYNEALAIFHVTYDYAKTNGVGKCNFVWKVAGRALCTLYATLQDKDIWKVLREILN
ncbi:hypothetical protein IFM89_022617 [Coptis chinensis]|uniref:RNA-dependent RNA polymerase n=1 Tax=Coptis chinensis TaxID=261450 RepID=A0A835IAH2_9MAGN|nr:hypothetical protein IFM89_022617 [Coptis chinensis]